MKHEQIVNAIKFIYPEGANFTIKDEEIEWLDETKTQPSQAEIETAWLAFQEKVEADKLEAISKKALVEAKLEALGLTSDDLKVLGL